jgi:hypothetical protein
MDERTARRDADGSYIWLRHTMQVNSGKRVHTLHVDIPVPLGASAEVRGRLIREAEAGIEQLADHIEGQTRQTQAPQPQPQSQSQRPQAQPPQSTVPPARQSQPEIPTPVPPARASMPASQGTISNGAKTRETSQASASAQTPESVPEEAVIPPSRQNIGASMPNSPADVGGSLTLPQFLQFLKELGLDARQAMDYLRVKTLSGLNYREALDQIQQIILREQAGQMATAQSQTQDAQKPRNAGSSSTSNTLNASAAKQESKASASPSTTSSGPNSVPRSSSTASSAGRSPAPTMPPKPSPQAQANTTASVPQGVEELKNATLREAPPTYFDEEVDFEDEGDLGGLMSELTDMEREQAQDILARLQEAHGSSNASEARLKVLRNVVNDQVPDDRLEELIQGVWGVNSLRKLKDEQLETLISWAKTTDDFIADVDIVLTLLQEDEYAGSDR